MQNTKRNSTSHTWKCFVSTRHSRQENIDLKNRNWLTCSVKRPWKTWKLRERAAIQCPPCLFLKRDLGCPSSPYNSAWCYTNTGLLGFRVLFWVWWGFFCCLFVWFSGFFLVMYYIEMPKQYSCLEISGLIHLHAWSIVLASSPLCKVKWSIGSNLT